MLAKTVSALKADKAKALDMINKGDFLDRDLYPYYFNIGDGKVVAAGNPNARANIGLDERTFRIDPHPPAPASCASRAVPLVRSSFPLGKT
jgi:hypothetical protein